MKRAKDDHDGGKRRNARIFMRITASLIPVALILLVFRPIVAVDVSSGIPSSTAYATTDANDDDVDIADVNESRIVQALSHHATKSHQLLERALEEGGALATIEIGADGNVASGNEGELWQAEFAIEALERELEVLSEMKSGGYDDSGDGNESGDDGSEDDDNEYYSSDDGDDDYEQDDFYEEDSEDDYEGGYYEDEVFIYDDGVTMNDYLRQDKSLKEILDVFTDERAKIEAYEDIRDQAQRKDELNPELWYEYSYWELHAYFSCHRSFAGHTPIYDDVKWAEVRDHWNEFRKKDAEEFPIAEGEEERTYQYTTGSFDPPLTAFHAGGAKGRGLKAARPIYKGELVFKATNNTVIFTHGHTWRKFLFSIYEKNGEPYDSGSTCDVLVWSWVQPLEEDGPLVIVADLDNGSLLNEGRENDPNWEDPNVRCGQEGDEMCMMSYYATKDIEEGEELLCDYRAFALLQSWPDMGL